MLWHVVCLIYSTLSSSIGLVVVVIALYEYLHHRHHASRACRDDTAADLGAPQADSVTSNAVPSQPEPSAATHARVVIAYASHSRRTYALAHRLFSLLTATLATTPLELKVLELREEDGACSVEMLLEDIRCVMVVFVVGTHTDGTAPPRSREFELLLKDAFEDHRVARDALTGKCMALYGLGDIAYGATHFNAFAKHLHLWCRGLGAPSFVVPPVYATESKAAGLFQIFATGLQKWLERAELVRVGGDRWRLHRPRRAAPVAVEDGSDAASDATSAAEDVDDVEDVVGADDVTITSDPTQPLPELLYPALRDSLVKQGYRVLGTHAGVKLCRWTKSMLRGRGGCYKHTFYNINSAQCMEMTTSLACANKCVFCWRHHTNPVSRSFRWKQDPPDLLLARGLEEHGRMLRELRGVPGVTPERLAEAQRVRHCALSLVGEPIMYPQINTFCAMLHARQISSFMVTNAQFPEQLRDLVPVTQLYLSIDAPTPEALKRIDRPLFEDYWERCLACVRALRLKRQRTVFRLTLVNAYNNDYVDAYADLVQMGWPDFIEVKGVTYCGTSRTSTLTMKDNVPRHDEVLQFCADLCRSIAQRTATGEVKERVAGHGTTRGGSYHIACEHEHSCCVLIALDKFYWDGAWHTWIDYDKFHALVAEGRDDFTSLDYAATTPEWATYNSQEKGFDPSQVRVTGKKARPTEHTAAISDAVVAVHA